MYWYDLILELSVDVDEIRYDNDDKFAAMLK